MAGDVVKDAGVCVPDQTVPGPRQVSCEPQPFVVDADGVDPAIGEPNVGGLLGGAALGDRGQQVNQVEVVATTPDPGGQRG